MTAPAPTVCRFCGGEETMPVIEMRGNVVEVAKVLPCPFCCCDICGQPTDTPPVCARCDIADDDRYRRLRDV